MAKIIKGNFARPKDNTEKKNKKTVPIYQFKVFLTYSEPLIWRRFQIPGEYTLGQLHDVLTLLMDWSGEEAHRFYVGKIFYEMSSKQSEKEESLRFDEAKYSLHDLEESMKWCFLYLYDGPESWEHEIELEEILSANEGKNYPVVLAGERAAPPEDCGGIHSYEKSLEKLHAQAMSTGENGVVELDSMNMKLKKMLRSTS